ncbi:MAG: HD domain-containing protein [Rhodocyclaceae bacterium]|nr:HD domain-containing protein [Rhodocyclaceae bacterium]
MAEPTRILDVQTAPLPSPVTDLLPQKLPPIFRIQSIERLPMPNGNVLTRASLYHDQAGLKVAWLARHPDIRLVQGSLASIRWLGQPLSVEGHVRISRLVLIERPEPEVDLFRTVPHLWVKDRALLCRASLLWERLPRAFRHLFNALLWDGRRFQRFVMGPSSLENHHNDINGNLRHSVEVAEQALALADGRELVNVPVLLLAALIHDLGKADEYRFDRLRRRFEISQEGELVCHRDRLQHWIAAAMARHRVILPHEHYLALIHALTAAKGAPPHLGLREPRSLEATILSMADRLSGENELFGRLANPAGGFGKYHRHLKGRPYVAANATA